jgi:hypothetical protein
MRAVNLPTSATITIVAKLLEVVGLATDLHQARALVSSTLN